jgi:hypothetical protein
VEDGLGGRVLASSGSLEFREPGRTVTTRMSRRRHTGRVTFMGAPWQLGPDRGTAGAGSFGDLGQSGKVLLMDALGETWWTTEDNYPLRLSLPADL